MLKYKHTALAALMLVHNAFAGTMGTHDCLVNVPCNTSAWSFAGQALYLNPTLDNNALSTMYQIEPNGTNDFLVFNRVMVGVLKLKGLTILGKAKTLILIGIILTMVINKALKMLMMPLLTATLLARQARCIITQTGMRRMPN